MEAILKVPASDLGSADDQALDEIIDQAGPDRAGYLLERLMERAANLGVRPPLHFNTPYINTIPPAVNEGQWRLYDV